MRSRLPLSFGAVLIGTLAVLAACSNPADDAVVQPASPAPASTAAPAAAQGVPLGTGKVLETMDAGAYTYVRVDLSGRDVWAAGPRVSLKPGDTVTLPAGMAMSDYRSATLDRTFPLVYFVSAIQPGGAAARDAEAIDAAHKRVATAAPAAAPVARLDGGRTVEEIFTQSAALAGKDVAVRARVVKFNAGIMGSNWIHVQDGTGSAGTNDLTITTDAAAAVGDVVVVRGKVTTDKDFGSGYRYAVIIEKATIEKQ
jgi:hypothetical protein